MSEPYVAGDLTDIGRTLLELATPAQRPAAEAILARTRERRLRVLVAGEAKRGKSTLLNRLLGRDLLPTGVLPVTAVSTTVRYGDADELRVRYLDGREQTHPLEELAHFVTERANPANTLGVADTEAVLGGGRLAGYGVEIVDTPGTGSVYEHNTQAAQDAYASLDAVIMVLTATPPMNAAERELLTQVGRHAVRTFVALNKADQLSADELAETVEFTTAVCGECGVAAGQLYAMSARDADAGFATFRAEFESYLTDRGEADAERALRGHGLRLAQSMRDEVAIELRAVELAGTDSRAKLVAFTEHLAKLSAQAAELADRCHATQGRLRRELDGQARELVDQLVPRCRAETQAAFADASDLRPVEIEERGREVVEQVITGAVLPWRDAQARRLEHQLDELVTGIEDERARHLDSLRQAAQDELGIGIAATLEPLPLHSGRLFWLDFGTAPAVELPGTELVRRHGPGAARRAQQRVLAGVREMTDRQVGRSRADLQQRLGETVRRMVAALTLHHADTLDRLQAALHRAAETSDHTAAQAEAERDRLHDRLARIDAVIGVLDPGRDIGPGPA